MKRRLHTLASVAIAFALVSAVDVRDVVGAPITWRASGSVHIFSDPFGVLSGVPDGTPWQLEFTFDPTSSGTLLPITCTEPIYYYSGAISSTIFQLGSFTYTNPRGDVFTNWDLPIGSCPAPSGMVQFQWLGGWVTQPGSPNLNFGAGLMLASYIDLVAVDGSLPFVPQMNGGNQFSGLFWTSLFGPEQFGSSFDPQVAPTAVPEPASLLLVGSGVAFIARRFRRRT
jgi:hypothetical protein